MSGNNRRNRRTGAHKPVGREGVSAAAALSLVAKSGEIPIGQRR
jgi:hypothetical protein